MIGDQAVAVASVRAAALPFFALPLATDLLSFQAANLERLNQHLFGRRCSRQLIGSEFRLVGDWDVIIEQVPVVLGTDLLEHRLGYAAITLDR
jgi:hypothetical protein